MSDDTQSGTTIEPSYRQPQQGLPGWGVAVAACGVVITGHLLGVAWLRETVLGVPAGLWLIGLLVCIFSAAARRGLAAGLERIWGLLEPTAGAREIAAETDARASGWWPRHQVASVCLDGLTRAGALLVRIGWLPIWGGEVSVAGDARRRFEAWIGGLNLPTRPLRVGLCMPDEEAEALVSAEGSARVEWYRLASWEDPQSACRRHLFDAAVYHDSEGPVRVVTLERPGHTAGIVEWADLVGDLNFGKLFPARVDPAAVVIEGATRTRVREGADLLRALVEAAATLARSQHRLELADKVLGRRPTDLVERPAGLSLWRAPRSAAAGVMSHLVRTAAEQAAAWPEAAAIAADAGSAYFVAAEEMSPSERRDGLRIANRSGGSGATAALRLGAACIAALEDDEGMGWLVQADAALRDGAAGLAELDHAAFLESELVHGSEDPMSVGRAAAGICMVCASTEPERVSFVRDDMLEEMAYAGWLVGRDQDRALLMRVFLEIEHAHETQARQAEAADGETATPAPTPKRKPRGTAAKKPAARPKARAKPGSKAASKAGPKAASVKSSSKAAATPRAAKATAKKSTKKPAPRAKPATKSSTRTRSSSARKAA